MSKQILGFDLLKFIMALFIVAIHCALADVLSVNYSEIGGYWSASRAGRPLVFRN